MGDKTGIEWTDATWNPIVGCSIVSPGCTNCYAMKQAARIERMSTQSHYAGLTQASKGGPVWTGGIALAPAHILAAPLKWKRPRRIFVNSMGDLFHESVPDWGIDRVFAVMALCPQHTFQVLTKRSKRMRAYNSDPATPGRIARRCVDLWLAKKVTPDDNWPVKSIGDVDFPDDITLRAWPLLNVWLGVSAERQPELNTRWPDLEATPAAVRFISYEPALGPLDLTDIRNPGRFPGCLRINGLAGREYHEDDDNRWTRANRIDWVICGGESGPHARPLHPDWARSVRDQCAGAGVPFFFKQHGEWIGVPDLRNLLGGSGPGFGAYDHCKHDMDAECVRVSKKAAGRLLDGVEHNAFPSPSHPEPVEGSGDGPGARGAR